MGEHPRRRPMDALDPNQRKLWQMPPLPQKTPLSTLTSLSECSVIVKLLLMDFGDQEGRRDSVNPVNFP
jgi:hypothetical protein